MESAERLALQLGVLARRIHQVETATDAKDLKKMRKRDQLTEEEERAMMAPPGVNPDAEFGDARQINDLEIEDFQDEGIENDALEDELLGFSEPENDNEDGNPGNNV